MTARHTLRRAHLHIRIAMALGLGLVALLASAGAASAASIWTAIPSNTTQTINAIDYQSSSRFLYATAGGQIFQQGSATPALNASGVVFNDIAQQAAPATVAIAVGNGGKAYRSVDGGTSWLPINGLQNYGGCDGTSGSPATLQPLTNDLQSVKWVPGTDTVYLFGGYTVQKSTDAGMNFTEVNQTATQGCKANRGGISGFLTDAAFLDGNTGYFIGSYFGGLFTTADGYTSVAPRPVEMLNNAGGRPRMAIDRANPNDIWVVDHTGSVGTSGGFAYTDDGGSTSHNVTTAATGQNPGDLYDVDFSGGTLLAVGSQGQIYNSLDGKSIYSEPADGTNATKDWKAGSLADASHAAVGGLAGALIVTDKANTIPDIIRPTGSIAGPSTVRAGTPATFTAAVSDNPGGSGIDPNGFSWTTPGQAPAGTGSVTYTFPNPGEFSTSATITLSFKDLAGNVVAEPPTKTVTILPALATPKRRPGLTLKASPRRDKRAPFKFTFSGKVKAPAGTSCSGRVTVTVTAGKRRLRRSRVAVSSRCTYRVKVKFKSRRAMHRARRLKVTAAFGGNSQLRSATRKTTVRTK